MTPRPLVVVPARLKSTRLPRKPLVDLAGKPMILRTYERCLGVFPQEIVVVATDSSEIANVCEAQGVRVIMTRADHETGTDRVAEVAQMVGADIYINVQGDEPLFDEGDLKLLWRKAVQRPQDILNGYCPISSVEEFTSRSTPKVVFDQEGKLLYMSRSPVPCGKDASFKIGFRQVCAYAFPPAALECFRAHPHKTPLEAVEDIEILRFVELGWRVNMIEMSSRSIPVDTPSDVDRVLAAMAERKIA